MVHRKKQMKKDYGHASLCSIFGIGDRVKKTHVDKSGTKYNLEGIILSLNSEYLEVFWDKCDGKYMPKDIGIAFSKCTRDEIFTLDNENSALLKSHKYL